MIQIKRRLGESIYIGTLRITVSELRNCATYLPLESIPAGIDDATGWDLREGIFGEFNAGLVRLVIGTSPIVSVLQRPGDQLTIYPNIVIRTIKASEGRVRLGIEAPPGLRVRRGELLDQNEVLDMQKRLQANAGQSKRAR